MAHAGVYSPSAPRFSANLWLALLLLSLFLHALPLILVVVPFQPAEIRPPAAHKLEIFLSPALEAQRSPVSVAKPAAPAAPPAAVPPPPPAVQPKPPEPEPAQPQAKAEEPGKKPEPEKETPKANPIPEEDAFEKTRMMAADLAKKEAQPPQNADFIGASNSAAADRAKKDKPIGMATMEGESREVANLGRRGETGKPAPLTDPRLGSVKKEGAPDVGKPLVPEDAHQKEPKLLDQPPAQAPVPAPAPERKAPAETTATPVLLPEPRTVPQPAPEVGAGQPARLTGTEPKERPKEPAPQKAPLPERAVALPPEPEREATLRPAPEPPRVAPKPTDAELDRVLKLLERMESGRPAPDLALDPQGRRAFKGEDGIEGNLRLRPGEREAVGDVQTEHHATVAAGTGEVAFSKAADPEALYLKEFLGRMNQRWKVNIVAAGHTRLEFGMVRMRITIERAGKRVEAAEVKRTGDVSDQAVTHCKRGIEEVEAPGPFPASLAGKEKIIWTVTFLYR